MILSAQQFRDLSASLAQIMSAQVVSGGEEAEIQTVDWQSYLLDLDDPIDGLIVLKGLPSGDLLEVLQEQVSRRILERGVLIEVCPTSNLRTGVVAHWDQHPVIGLIDAGALVTINTDDPAMFDVSLAGEFSNLEQRLGLDDTALERLSLGAVRGSWADDETRADLRGRIEDWWAAP